MTMIAARERRGNPVPPPWPSSGRKLSPAVVNGRVRVSGQHTPTDHYAAQLEPGRNGSLTLAEGIELRRLAVESSQLDGGPGSQTCAWGWCPDGRQWEAVFVGKRAALRFIGRKGGAA